MKGYAGCPSPLAMDQLCFHFALERLNYHALKGVDSSFIDHRPRRDRSYTISRSVTSRGSRGSVFIELDVQSFDKDSFSFPFQVLCGIHVPIMNIVA